MDDIAKTLKKLDEIVEIAIGKVRTAQDAKTRGIFLRVAIDAQKHKVAIMQETGLLPKRV